MILEIITALLVSAPPSDVERRAIEEVAIAQLSEVDPAWQPEQRDCAGFIRFVLRTAYRRFAPERVLEGLFLDRKGRPSAFADAETLLENSFEPIGRSLELRPKTGDILAFRSETGLADAPVYHLMLFLEKSSGDLVIYHPGEKNSGVVLGRVQDLVTRAPLEWRPIPQNSHFLGVYRFRGLPK